MSYKVKTLFAKSYDAVVWSSFSVIIIIINKINKNVKLQTTQRLLYFFAEKTCPVQNAKHSLVNLDYYRTKRNQAVIFKNSTALRVPLHQLHFKITDFYRFDLAVWESEAFAPPMIDNRNILRLSRTSVKFFLWLDEFLFKFVLSSFLH